MNEVLEEEVGFFFFTGAQKLPPWWLPQSRSVTASSDKGQQARCGPHRALSSQPSGVPLPPRSLLFLF